MSDNLFASAENVGQLFDALWYHATQAVEVGAHGKLEHSQHARAHAISAAHKRFLELTES